MTLEDFSQNDQDDKGKRHRLHGLPKKITNIFVYNCNASNFIRSVTITLIKL